MGSAATARTRSIRLTRWPGVLGLASSPGHSRCRYIFYCLVIRLFARVLFVRVRRVRRIQPYSTCCGNRPGCIRPTFSCRSIALRGCSIVSRSGMPTRSRSSVVRSQSHIVLKLRARTNAWKAFRSTVNGEFDIAQVSVELSRTAHTQARNIAPCCFFDILLVHGSPRVLS